MSKVKTLSSKKPRSHLLLPDRQATEGCNLDIDRAVGNYIVKHRPDVIIDIGDQADMPSLSQYDKGKKVSEGRRYQTDIDWSIMAHEARMAPLRKLQEKQKNIGKYYKYDPIFVITLGNHEHRIVRAAENDPAMEGKIDLKDLELDKYYDHVMPFLEPIIIDGVMYVHYAFKTMTHSAMAGKHAARSILDTYMCSVSVGHSPIFDYSETHAKNDCKIQAIVAGCCFDHFEAYAGQRNKRYWRGIVHKKEVQDGVYDFEKISLNRLLRDYL